MELPDGISPQVVPDLGGPEYDNGDFLTYPERQGWNLDALLRWDILAAYDGWEQAFLSFEDDLSAMCEDWDFEPLQELGFENIYSKFDQIIQDNPMNASQENELKVQGRQLLRSIIGGFVQTWIIFGILNVALRRPVLREEISISATEIDEATGSEVTIRSISLRKVFTDCALEFDQKLQEEPEWSAHLIKCLRCAMVFLEKFEESIPAPIHYYIIPREVEVSLVCFLNTLDLHQTLHSQRHFRAAMQHCTALDREMREDHGWCPSLMARLRLGGAQAIYYLSQIQGFRTKETHDTCNDDTCIAFNIDQTTYRTKHALGCLNVEEQGQSQEALCRMVYVPEHEFPGLFEGEGYPLVGFKDGKLELVRCKEGMPYVAISHVWSDGRGNPRRNSLPSCQLENIYRWACECVGRDTLFWIDTLCVPVKEPLRNTAIIRMAATYKSAVCVLVLSEELLTWNLPKQLLQALYMIYCSKWMTRLWTMQEAILAKTLKFQFRDDAVQFSTVVDEVFRSPSVPMANDSGQSRIFGLHMLTQMQFFGSLGAPDALSGDSLTFNKLLWTWQDRSTSRLTDATICASILLGTNLDQVLAVSDEMKMAKFWSCQDKAPLSVLWSRGPRFNENGLRWAPRNLLDPLTRRTLLGARGDEEATATVTPEGLLVTGITVLSLERLTCVPDNYPDEFILVRQPSPDSSQHFQLHFERTVLPDIKHALDGRCLLLLEEMSYEPDTRRACLTVLSHPAQTVTASTDDKVPTPIKFLSNNVIILNESLDEPDRNLHRAVHMQVVHSFESSRKWLVT